MVILIPVYSVAHRFFVPLYDRYKKKGCSLTETVGVVMSQQSRQAGSAGLTAGKEVMEVSAGITAGKKVKEVN